MKLKHLYTQISTFFAMDLILSSVVFMIYLRHEARRYYIKHRWLYLIALCAAGLSFVLPATQANIRVTQLL
jgi:Terpene cyclase DEP1